MMKATFSILATLALAATSLMAQAKPQIKVNVPFSFVAGSKTLPAGEYQLQTERPNLVAIQSKDWKTNMRFVAHAAESRQMEGVTALTFNRYGDRYFLSKIWTGDAVGQELPQSRAEREQIATLPVSRGVVTLAAER